MLAPLLDAEGTLEDGKQPRVDLGVRYVAAPHWCPVDLAVCEPLEPREGGCEGCSAFFCCTKSLMAFPGRGGGVGRLLLARRFPAASECGLDFGGAGVKSFFALAAQSNSVAVVARDAVARDLESFWRSLFIVLTIR